MSRGSTNLTVNVNNMRLTKREDRGRHQREFITLFSLVLCMIVINLVTTSPKKYIFYKILISSSSLPPSLSTTVSFLGNSIPTKNRTIDDGTVLKYNNVTTVATTRGLSQPTEAQSNAVGLAIASTSTAPNTIVPHLQQQDRAADVDNATAEAKTTFAGTPSQQQEQDSVRVPQVSGNKTFTHFYSHIPKTGGYYAAPVLWKLMWGSQQYQSLNTSQLFRMCNQGVMPTSQFDKFIEAWAKVKCTMWMTEAPWTEKAKYIYTVTRDPRSHVISQYFHCTESKDHASRRKYMPGTLQEWVQAWVDFDAEAEKTGYNRTVYRGLPSFKKVQDFRCYDPRNMQSKYVQFEPEAGDDRTSLESKFRVLGDLTRMDQTVCAIATEYLEYVPPACDCTSMVSSSNASHTQPSNSLDLLRNNTSHGVQHHGASHKTTAEEDELIARLVRTDQLLYNHATEIFDKQLKRLEAKYGVSMCEKLSLP